MSRLCGCPPCSLLLAAAAAAVSLPLQWDHPDLAANLQPSTDSYKASNTDCYGHGTVVAGIMGAVSRDVLMVCIECNIEYPSLNALRATNLLRQVGNNSVGIAGTALRARMLPVKVLDCLGSGMISNVVKGISYCRCALGRAAMTLPSHSTAFP